MRVQLLVLFTLQYQWLYDQVGEQPIVFWCRLPTLCVH